MTFIYADINKYDENYRIILTTFGTQRDLERYKITLRDGLNLTFYMDDEDENGNVDNLIFEGVIQYDEMNARWVAIIDWDKIKNMSKSGSFSYGDN